MVPIPYALTYKTTLQGRVPKLVSCEACSFEYVYLLEQTISAESSSFLFLDNAGAEERSQRDAAELLQRELDHGCEVVPCPGCGQIQQHMFGLARWRRY